MLMLHHKKGAIDLLKIVLSAILLPIVLGLDVVLFISLFLFYAVYKAAVLLRNAVQRKADYAPSKYKDGISN